MTSHTAATAFISATPTFAQPLPIRPTRPRFPSHKHLQTHSPPYRPPVRKHRAVTLTFTAADPNAAHATPPTVPPTARTNAASQTLCWRSVATALAAVLTAVLKPHHERMRPSPTPTAHERLVARTPPRSCAARPAHARTLAVIPPPAAVASTHATTLSTRLAIVRQQALTLRQTLAQTLQKATDGDQQNGEHSSHGAAVNDALVLLLTTVVIIPLTKRFGISPILGFLAAGFALGPNGLALIRDVRTSKALAELGVVFFLFEMGLELSTDKLKSLGSDVFGLGTAQFLITGAIISIVASLSGLPSQAAIVIGAGLALSSSAFVLQLLSERGEVGTRFGRASFGILLFQDLAVVPVLVLTPLLAGSGGAATVLRAISIASAKAAAALLFIFFMGQNFLQPIFRSVARSKSSEAFIAAILFTVLATSSLTQMLGLSDTLGAFLAGVMLAETKFRHQIEADIKPFRGLLLGLFFITVGFSIDLNLAYAKMGAVASMVSGLVLAKTAVISAAAVAFGISVASSLRTGLLLSQGGEFAFVIFGLAMSVGVLPNDMGQLLLLVVALSMASTPLLADLGRRIASTLEKKRGLIGVRMEDADTADARDFVMVAGWGRVGQSVCEMLDAKLVRYMAFDMSPTRVIDARNKGLPVFFGDARRPEVLRSAGVERARAIVVTLDNPDQALDAVQNIRREFESVHIFCRARDSHHQKLLQAAGATAIVPELLEASLLLGGAVLLDYGTPIEEVNVLIEESRAENVAAMGISDSVTATLGSSFKQLERISEGESAVVEPKAVDDNNDIDDDNGNTAAPPTDAEVLSHSKTAVSQTSDEQHISTAAPSPPSQAPGGDEGNSVSPSPR